MADLLWGLLWILRKGPWGRTRYVRPYLLRMEHLTMTLFVPLSTVCSGVGAAHWPSVRLLAWVPDSPCPTNAEGAFTATVMWTQSQSWIPVLVLPLPSDTVLVGTLSVPRFPHLYLRANSMPP